MTENPSQRENLQRSQGWGGGGTRFPKKKRMAWNILDVERKSPPT